MKNSFLSAPTILRLLEKRAIKTPTSIAYWSMDSLGQWQPTTWHEYKIFVFNLSFELQKIGICPRQKIGIMAPTSQTWEAFQMAILFLGGIVVGIDPFDSDKNIEDIIKTTELSGIIIQHDNLLKKISTSTLNSLNYIVEIDKGSNNCGVNKLISFPDIKKNFNKEINRAFYPRPIIAHEPAFIIFTSGTTGQPKGMIYSHHQVILACTSILDSFDEINEGNHLACWLPLSNLFQRMINFCAISVGATTYFVENPQNIIKQLPTINPHIFIGVPRFFEKLHSGIMAEINQKPFWQKALVIWAQKVGNTYAHSLRQGITPSCLTSFFHKIFDPFILKQIRKFMGVNLKYVITGSASMPLWLLEWYHSIGILILEAYGVSENIIPITMNLPTSVRFGTVGKPLPKNKLKLSEDGELLVKGPGVFCGYYKENCNLKVLTADGYLATGDYAEIDKDGFVKLKGRKSEIFKTSTGRRITPFVIEEKIQQIEYVEHVVIVGENRKSLIALLSISTPSLLKTLNKCSKITSIDLKTAPVQIYNIIRSDIINKTSTLPPYLHLSGILIIPRPFKIEEDEITSNLKLRRKKIIDKFNEQIKILYMEIERLSLSTQDTTEKFNQIVIQFI